jgi:ArsR family transcriptional regulator, lead/cadmium/zinc/bismuth-responsive transcriptional repressor
MNSMNSMNSMNEEHCDLVCLDLPRAKALRERRLSMEGARLAASAAQALADPTRLLLAALLRDGGELCVCDLACLTGRAINLVSHHLKALRLSDLVRPRREGKLVLYALTPRGRVLVEVLLETTLLPIPEEVLL